MDSTWTIVFKALIIIHLMAREGQADVTLKYLADKPSKLDVGSFSDGKHAISSPAVGGAEWHSGLSNLKLHSILTAH